MKFIPKVLLFLLLVLVLILLRTLYYGGIFRKLTYTNSGKLEIITGMVGAEDITIDHETGLAIVSSCDRRKVASGNPVKGAIYLLDFKNSPATYIDMTQTFDQKDFRPHGISLFIDPVDSSKWVFVVNHRSSGHSIEIFKYSDSTLTHSETIKHELIQRPNDVVATGKRSFYFTNDHDKNDGTKATIEDLLLIGTGSVGYFDGQDAKLLDTGIRYANGITIDEVRKKLLIASPTDGNIYLYNLNPFTKIQTLKCNTGVDNLEWDADGNLWVGAHPKLLKFLKHSKDKKNLSPSHIIKINFDNPEKPQISDFYVSDGAQFSGSTVAAVYQNTVLIGSVFEDGVLVLKK
jgi:arylesterase/paraoxonase